MKKHLSRDSIILLFAVVFFLFYSLSHFFKYKNQIFGSEVILSDVLYDTFVIHRYGSGYKGMGETYELTNFRGDTLHVSPGAWAYSLYHNKPSLDHEKSFEAGYLEKPEEKIVFVRQNGVVILELNDGLFMANKSYKFEKWISLCNFSILFFIFYFCVRSVRCDLRGEEGFYV